MMYLLIPLALWAQGCKERNNHEKPPEMPAESKTENPVPLTYAEVSIKEGGQWNGRKYEGGSFKNVEGLDVPQEVTDHSFYMRYEGPGWENRQIAYRLYLDWRNAIDIFGKKTDSLVLPYIGKDGYSSYHDDAAWGQDILKAGKSLGIGGYGQMVGDSVVHFQEVGKTTAKIINTPNESGVDIDYKDWIVEDDALDLKVMLRIFPEGRYTRATLVPSKTVPGLCTGIVKFEDIPLIQKTGRRGKWAYLATYGTQTLAKPTDNLGMAILYRIDQVAEIHDSKYDHLVIFHPSETPITYYFLGAWDQEPQGITSKNQFLEILDQRLITLEEKNILN